MYTCFWRSSIPRFSGPSHRNVILLARCVCASTSSCSGTSQGSLIQAAPPVVPVFRKDRGLHNSFYQYVGDSFAGFQLGRRRRVSEGHRRGGRPERIAASEEASLSFLFIFFFLKYSSSVLRTFLSLSLDRWITTGREMIFINILTLAFIFGE